MGIKPRIVVGHPTLGGETYVFAPVRLFVCSSRWGGKKCPTECPTRERREYRLQTWPKARIVVGHPTLGGETYVFAHVRLFV